MVSLGPKDIILTPVSFTTLLQKIESRETRAGVIGLGYVGLPLAVTLARGGFTVTGFDIDPDKITALTGGKSYIEAVSNEALAEQAKHFRSTTDFSELAHCDVIVICVPT